MGDNRLHADPFVEAVGRVIRQRSLIARGAAVVAAVSGGADSVALLAALDALSRLGGDYRLNVAHVNHCLRPDADADEEFVRGLAGKMGIPFHCVRRDVAAEAKAAGIGIEEAARDARYEFFAETAAKIGSAVVAVGHHGDDNVETVLYRIIRGTHLRGLGGMRASRPLGTGGAMLVRPLLECTRTQIEEFCRRQDFAWRTDSTNADVRYRRNLIRHELLPLLRKINRRADEAVLRLAEGADEAEAYVAAQAAGAMAGLWRPEPGDAWSLDSAAAALPAVIRKHLLRSALEQLGAPMRMIGQQRLGELDALLTAPQGAMEEMPYGATTTGRRREPQSTPKRVRLRVARTGGGAMSLPGGWHVRRQGGRLVFSRGAIQHSPTSALEGGTNGQATKEEEFTALAVPGQTTLPDGRVVMCRVETFDAAAVDEHCRRRPVGEGGLPVVGCGLRAGGVELLDAGQLSGPLVCRTRRDGDCFVPLGAPGRASVSDFLTNAKLPSDLRRRVRCICDDLGIVYLAPLRIDDRVKVTKATEEVVRIEMGGGTQ